jgi:adenylate cyclase
MGIDENRNGAYLEVEIGGRKQGFPLSSDRICRIGRSDDNTIVLDNDSVSRNHALLQALPGGAFLIVDLGSRNGTFVNGRRLVAAAVLRNADHITIGKIEITFNQAGQNDNLEAALASSGTTDVNFDRKLITVLVVDVRGYTVLAQQLDTDKLSQVAGALFRGAGKLLQESGAWTQKYIGDAVMAVWLHRDDGSELGREALSVLERHSK